MNVLITGGKGFIGHNLTVFLKSKGLRITVIDNNSRVSPNFIKLNGVNYITKDVKELHKIKNINVDVVIHLAATVSTEQCDKEVLSSLENNIISTVSVLEFCRKQKVKILIFSSTAAVYTKQKNNYGISKYICEHLIKQSTTKSVILRFFNVYGPGSHNSGIYTPVIDKFIELKKQNKQLTIYYPGTQTRDFIHVQDICQLIYNVLKTNIKFKSKTFDVCTGKSVKIKKIAKLISENIITVKRDLNEVIKSKSKNPYKTTKHFNWSPKFTIKKFIKQLYATGRN